jgi:CheY-like chemotaxis protein
MKSARTTGAGAPAQERATAHVELHEKAGEMCESSPGSCASRYHRNTLRGPAARKWGPSTSGPEESRVPTKILVADDSVTMRRVLEMTFAGEDATVLTVDGAEAALAKIADFAPDVVMADASLPGVDGYELAKRIKTNPQFAKTAVFVMASQQAPYDEAKGRAAGVDEHISKPFDTQSVIDRVTQALNKPRAQASSGESGKQPPARPAPPAPMNGPATGTTGRLPQGGRTGGPVPIAAAPAKAAPQPIPALRPGAQPMAAPPRQPAAPPPVARPAAAAAQPMAAPAHPVTQPSNAAVQVATQELGAKLAHLGLTREQLEGVLALSREVIEQVVWEVVPDLAEQIIKEELKRLTAE